MLPWVLLATAPIPDGTELRLYQRGKSFSIRVGVGELMGSGASGSERALADLAYDRIAGRPAPHVLVGGLGMGFTAAAALRRSPPDGRVTVAELVPGVVEWNRGPLADLAGRPLDDPRLAVRVGDVGEALRAGRDAYDAILLDVDNGPNAMTTKANAWLYGPAGLSAAYQALRPGGVLAVWSAVPDDAFSHRLRRIGFLAEVVQVREHGSRGRRHWIWLAQRATRAEHERRRRQRERRPSRGR